MNKQTRDFLEYQRGIQGMLDECEAKKLIEFSNKLFKETIEKKIKWYYRPINYYPLMLKRWFKKEWAQAKKFHNGVVKQSK